MPEYTRNPPSSYTAFGTAVKFTEVVTRLCDLEDIVAVSMPEKQQSDHKPWESCT